MRQVFVALGLIALIPAAGHANPKSWQVNPLPGTGNFELIDGTFADSRRIWCEAGNFAFKSLRARGTDRLYILHPNGPARTKSNARGTGFTINPTSELLAQSVRGGESGHESLSTSQVGYSLSITRARNFCDLGEFY